jgi:hypothetical protein
VNVFDASIPWLSLFALGAVHGINPAMGWLFAVGLGLQERDRRAVLYALGPLALGHALAIAAAVLVAITLGQLLSVRALQWLVATVLVAFGVMRLAGHHHTMRGRMRMTSRELTVWSFLMASAHGAGLMVLPLVLGAGASVPMSSHHHGSTAVAGRRVDVLQAGVFSANAVELSAPLIHTIGYLAITALVAVVVYEKLGLRMLRRAWINVDLIWAAALIVAGVMTPLL